MSRTNQSADPVHSASSGVTPVGKLGFRGRAATPEERARILDTFFFEGDRRVPYLQQFFVLMVLSTAIAAFGLANDSAAVVIGAMLVAPLMTPLIGCGLAVVQEHSGSCRVPAQKQFAARWLCDAAERVLRARLVARIQPVVHGKQREPVTLAAARLGGKADIGACCFLELAILGEARGAGFRGATERSAAGRSTGGKDERKQQHGNGACFAVPLPGRMFLKIHCSCTFD